MGLLFCDHMLGYGDNGWNANSRDLLSSTLFFIKTFFINETIWSTDKVSGCNLHFYSLHWFFVFNLNIRMNAFILILLESKLLMKKYFSLLVFVWNICNSTYSYIMNSIFFSSLNSILPYLTKSKHLPKMVIFYREISF